MKNKRTPNFFSRQKSVAAKHSTDEVGDFDGEAPTSFESAELPARKEHNDTQSGHKNRQNPCPLATTLRPHSIRAYIYPAARPLPQVQVSSLPFRHSFLSNVYSLSRPPISLFLPLFYTASETTLNETFVSNIISSTRSALPTRPRV